MLNTFQRKHNNILKYIPLKIPVRLHYKLSIRCTSMCIIRSAILLGIELFSSPRTFRATLYHASYACFYVSSFKQGSWLPISFFIIFQTFSMEFISPEFPSHFITGFSLHSMQVLVLLELLHGARSCIKIYPFCGNTTHSH